MYTLKGFMVYGPLADNTVSVIAPLGELSTQSSTYSKEKGQYTNSLYNDSKFVSFRSRQETDGVEQLIPVPVAHQEMVLNIGQWIYDSSMNGDITGTQDRCLDLMTTRFAPAIYDITLGEMINDGFRWMPAWVMYSVTGESVNRVRFWCSDSAFRSQYDEYEMEFVPPLEPMDSFFNDPTLVKNTILSRSLSETFDKVEIVKNKNPYTYLINQEFEYIALLDRTNRFFTNWTVLIWGPAGNNPDIIKEELSKYILGLSTHLIDEWRLLFPDIFTSTEFIITPMWDQFAIPNRQIITGIYSPTTNLIRALGMAYATARGEGYNRDHLNNNLALSTTIYKSLSFLAIGGPYNTNEVYRFDEQWVDYLVVPSNTPDYNRMSIATQEWTTLFTKMLIVAETATLYSDIPTGMSRIIRDGIMYIAASYNRILYLIVSRQSLIDITTNPEEFPWVEALDVFLVNEGFVELQNEDDELLTV